jgi:dienelactone hydrolase
MIEKEIDYHHGETKLKGLLVTEGGRRPGILVAPTFAGRNSFIIEKAREVAKLGLAAFVVDMYGDGRTSTNRDECRSWMKPLTDDRFLLRERILSAFATVKELSEVNAEQTAAIGFCFGGMCVLDLARSGARLHGVVSFHGLLGAPPSTEKIKAKVLVLHGYDDPMAKPEQLIAFAKEMTEAGADWQVHAYGHTVHSFTNPAAQDRAAGTAYDAQADRRSWRALRDFFEEIF